jgi:hypothetical protein
MMRITKTQCGYSMGCRARDENTAQPSGCSQSRNRLSVGSRTPVARPAWARSLGRRMTSRALKPIALRVVALAAVGIGVGLLVQRHHDSLFAARVRDAERTIGILRSAVAADTRFVDVSVSMTTGPGVFLTGTVGSRDDWDALQRLVEQTTTPFALSLQSGWTRIRRTSGCCQPRDDVSVRGRLPSARVCKPTNPQGSYADPVSSFKSARTV